MLWDVMYTNPEVSNLFINGIQGKHWDYTDDTETFINTPDGVDPNTSGYSSVDWSWPNQRITPVWEGNEADLWEPAGRVQHHRCCQPRYGLLLGLQQRAEPGYLCEQRYFPV